jgi:hypothetical protein
VGRISTNCDKIVPSSFEARKIRITEKMHMRGYALFFSAMVLVSFVVAFAGQKTASSRGHAEAELFWSNFQAAVAKNDGDSVTEMTKFPLSMPYGVRSVKSRLEFKKRYTRIFDAETRKCFSEAKPQWDGENDSKFSIKCGEAMMYWFEKVNGRFLFAAVDNVNE